MCQAPAENSGNLRNSDTILATATLYGIPLTEAFYNYKGLVQLIAVASSEAGCGVGSFSRLSPARFYQPRLRLSKPALCEEWACCFRDCSARSGNDSSLRASVANSGRKK